MALMTSCTFSLGDSKSWIRLLPKSIALVLKIKLMHLLLIKPPFCSVLLTLHRLCLHWSTGAFCLHSLSLFNFHRSPVDSRLYHFLSRFCMLSVGNELHRQLTLLIHHLRSGTAEPTEWPMNWPCCKSLCLLIFHPPNSLISWPYVKIGVEKYIPRIQKIGILQYVQFISTLCLLTLCLHKISFIIWMSLSSDTLKRQWVINGPWTGRKSWPTVLNVLEIMKCWSGI